MSSSDLPILFNRLAALGAPVAGQPEPATVPPRVDVAVVGAGVVGLSVAWRLAARGLAVALFEAGEAGGGTSAAASGMLAAAAEHEPGGDALLALALESQALWPAFRQDLERASGRGNRLSPRGDAGARGGTRRSGSPARPPRIAPPGRPLDAMAHRYGRQGARAGPAAQRHRGDRLSGRPPGRSASDARGLVRGFCNGRGPADRAPVRLGALARGWPRCRRRQRRPGLPGGRDRSGNRRPHRERILDPRRNPPAGAPPQGAVDSAAGPTGAAADRSCGLDRRHPPCAEIRRAAHPRRHHGRGRLRYGRHGGWRLRVAGRGPAGTAGRRGDGHRESVGQRPANLGRRCAGPRSHGARRAARGGRASSQRLPAGARHGARHRRCGHDRAGPRRCGPASGGRAAGRPRFAAVRAAQPGAA